jgi:peroxiredoxin
MSTVSSTLYRYADYLETPVPENFPSPNRNRERINPLTAGNYFPEIPAEEGNGIELFGQPTVVVFYSWHWNRYGDRLWEELKQSQAAIEAAGARLLIVSAEDKKQAKAVHPENWEVDIVYDAQFRIARQVGLFNDTDPIWGRVAGVNEDVPTPAVYVLNAASEIHYAFVDTYLQSALPVEEITAAIGNQLAKRA